MYIYLTCSRMRTVLFWIITQRVVVIPHRRQGATYRSHFQGSRIPKERNFLSSFLFLDSLQFKMEQMGCPETSARNYLYSMRNNIREGSSYLLGWRNPENSHR